MILEAGRRAPPPVPAEPAAAFAGVSDRAADSIAAQQKALESFLRTRTIERVSRAELRSQRDAALRDQAAFYERKLTLVTDERDAALDALEQVQREQARSYDTDAQSRQPTRQRRRSPSLMRSLKRLFDTLRRRRHSPDIISREETTDIPHRAE